MSKKDHLNKGVNGFIFAMIRTTVCFSLIAAFAVAGNALNYPKSITQTQTTKSVVQEQEKNGPIVKQASATGISVSVRDLPRASSVVPKQQPREINPQNTIPIKKRVKITSSTPKATLKKRISMSSKKAR